MIIRMNLGENSYDIRVERGALGKLGENMNLSRKVMIVTDTGVPREYAMAVAAQCAEPYIHTFHEGESSKNFDEYKAILTAMVEAGFTRSDCVVAVGGGVVGDISGFAAASYMRGVDFYNIPTTVLSQIDSSIGGKVAIDFEGYKNIVGAFHQPKAVVIDPDVLSSLPPRQIANGLAEAVKMALTSDAELFAMFEDGRYKRDIDTVIVRSLMIKKSVVEQDERESGLRKILNFGHTLAHAIESADGMATLYHGECVALGMIPMTADEVKPRLTAVLRDIGLPTGLEGNTEAILEAMDHDKKKSGANITVIEVPEIGKFKMTTVPMTELKSKMATLI